jgi:hypothetical protein
MKKKYYVTAFALVGSVISLTPLHAGVLFTFEEVGDDVVATTSGSIASGWANTGGDQLPVITTNGVISITGIRGQVIGGERFTAQGGFWANNNGLSGVSLLMNGTVTGDNFGFSSTNNFYAPDGTSLGDAFTPNTTITWANETFESMGLDTALTTTTPSVLFALDNNETISAVLSAGGAGGVSAIPEPSSLLGLAGLMTASTFLRRRRPCS